MQMEKPPENLRALLKDSQGSPLQIRTPVKSEYQLRHAAREAGETPVFFLISSQIGGLEAFCEHHRLIEREAHALSRDRIHRS